jgi:putative toxin-antitoxin system antitoxin component (TIGR02293 family)
MHAWLLTKASFVAIIKSNDKKGVYMLQHVEEERPKTNSISIAPAENYDLINKKVFDILGFFCEESPRERSKKIDKKITLAGSGFFRIHARGIPKGTFGLKVPASQHHCYTINSLENLIREGFPVISGDTVKETLGLTDEQLAEMIGMSLRTLQRKRKGSQRLTMVESDRLYRLARIYATATRVLQNDEMAKDWLNRPQRGLGGRIPVKVIETEAGAREVEDLLGRIEYGVIS